MRAVQNKTKQNKTKHKSVIINTEIVFIHIQKLVIIFTSYKPKQNNIFKTLINDMFITKIQRHL
ncbi:hypothetical protein VCHA53O466_40191 [Vibrio chagasii]|nr:hypothetical protein VCHA53O466_40191 [Vibrio chagasii]